MLFTFLFLWYWTRAILCCRWAQKRTNYYPLLKRWCVHKMDAHVCMKTPNSIVKSYKELEISTSWIFTSWAEPSWLSSRKGLITSWAGTERNSFSKYIKSFFYLLMIFKISFTLKQQFFEINKVSRGKIYNQLGAIHKGYLIFLAHIGPTYLLISNFWTHLLIYIYWYPIFANPLTN